MQSLITSPKIKIKGKLKKETIVNSMEIAIVVIIREKMIIKIEDTIAMIKELAILEVVTSGEHKKTRWSRSLKNNQKE